MGTYARRGRWLKHADKGIIFLGHVALVSRDFHSKVVINKVQNVSSIVHDSINYLLKSLTNSRP